MRWRLRLAFGKVDSRTRRWLSVLVTNDKVKLLDDIRAFLYIASPLTMLFSWSIKRRVNQSHNQIRIGAGIHGRDLEMMR